MSQFRNEAMQAAGVLVAPSSASARESRQGSGKKRASGPYSSPKGKQVGLHHVHWSDMEWLTIARALVRLFPELGLPDVNNVGRVRLRHINHAQNVLPAQRHRNLAALGIVHSKLTIAMRTLNGQSAPAERPAETVPAQAAQPPAAPAHAAAAEVLQQVIYRQPDGPANGAPASKVFWRESEWYAVAVELAYLNPALLESLNDLRPADVFRAQRVLPTNRRRPQTSFLNKHVRSELAPAFRRLRANIEAARRAQAEAAAQAVNEQAQQQAKQAAQAAAEDTIKAALLQSPDFIAQALSAAPIGAIFQALTAQLVTHAQTMIETAVINALSSERVKQALTVNLHLESKDAPTAALPTVTGNAPANVIAKPRIGIVGALAQQGNEIAAAFPQLRIKIVDKNLAGQSLREAVSGCDRVIAMTGFISHSTDGVCSKAVGDRYTRVDGGVSAVRRQIEVWIASGIIKTAASFAVPHHSSASVG